MTFWTVISLFNFCSLNLCLATIFQSINISVVPLSKSTFTVTPLCISTFSTLISNYTSLSILNILLTSLCSSPFLTVPLDLLSIYYLAALFSLWGTPLLSSSTILFFSLPYILGIEFFFFPILTPFLQLHPFFYTLHTLLLSSLLSLLLLLSSSTLLGIGCTTHFLLVSQGGILVSDFHGFVPPYFHILYSLHMLLPSLLLSILFLAEVHL